MSILRVQAADMSNELPDVGFSDLIDAFMRPPKLLPIDRRLETDDGVVHVLSHLELWPWRVVLRGAGADKNATDDGVRQLAIPSQTDVRGSSTVSVGVLRQEHLAENRAAMDRTVGWGIADDLGTEYRMIGASSGGGGRWWDFEVRFEPPMPTTVRRVMISAPNGELVEVAATFC
jgi:hypothetical protein